jgi:hypothetical protein
MKARPLLRWTLKFACALLAAQPAVWPYSLWAAGEARPSGSQIGAALSLEEDWSEFLRVGDAQPTIHGLAGGATELSFAWAGSWEVGLRGHLLGTRDAFTGAGTSGRTDVIQWGVRLGADRVLHRSPSDRARLGIGFDYGEVRSWLSTGAGDETGPHNYFAGPSVRAGMDHAVGTSLGLLAEMLAGFRFSHANGVSTTASHSWTSNSIAIAVGLRWGTAGP